MEQGQLSWVANFIWGIADDVLRDLYVRGKYRDVSSGEISSAAVSHAVMGSRMESRRAVLAH